MRAIVGRRVFWWATWVSLVGRGGQPAIEPAAPVVDHPVSPAAAPVSAPSKTEASPSRAAPAVVFPHPMITEVLFAVPTGAEGDANKDGKREVSGDEFIEIVNPHDRSIDLRGYTLTDGSAVAKTTLKFTFPSILVPPHGVVVVFNGHDSKIPGPVGDAKHAPASVNDRFAKAAVFTMRVTSSHVSFSNAGDAACLKAPNGAAVQRVRWGKADEKAGGAGFALDEIVPVTSKGSVQRDGTGKDGTWKVHTELDATPFSPGSFAAAGEPAPEATDGQSAPAHAKPGSGGAQGSKP